MINKIFILLTLLLTTKSFGVFGVNIGGQIRIPDYSHPAWNITTYGIGIPAPPFGIDETYRMYDSALNQNPALTYRDSPSGGKYTHYVDFSADGATDTSNPYGTVETPRKTIPTSYTAGLPAGSIVEVHDTLGNGYTDSNPYSSYFTWPTAQGTAQYPVFIRGVGTPEFIGMTFRLGGSYVIYEGLKFTNSNFVCHSAYTPATWNHICLRDIEITGYEGDANSMIGFSNATYSVIYNCHIHHNGNVAYGAGSDVHGISMGGGAQYVWILDCHIHHNDGDSIQLNGPSDEGWPIYVYIGLNELHEDRENAIDLKDSEYVTISQNTIYGYTTGDRIFGSVETPRTVHGSDGTAVLPSNEGCRSSWFIMNEVYDSVNAFRSDNELYVTIDAYSYFLGNIVHDCTYCGFITWYKADLFFAYNIVYNTDFGFYSDDNTGNSTYSLHNNVFSTQTDRWVRIDDLTNSANATIENSIFYSGGGFYWNGSGYSTVAAFIAGESGKGSGCVEDNPDFTNPAADDFSFQVGSPVEALSESSAVQTIFDLYETTFGVSIENEVRALF